MMPYSAFLKMIPVPLFSCDNANSCQHRQGPAVQHHIKVTHDNTLHWSCLSERAVQADAE